MAFIPAAQCVKVVVEGLLDGQEIANIYHVDANVTVTPTVINDILDVFEAWLVSDFLPDLSEDLEITALTGRDLTTSTGTLIERPLDPFLAGGIANEALPNNVAVCVTWFTELAGRSYRGRTYMPGLNESASTQSFIDGATAAGFATNMVELVNQLTAETFTLVVASFFSELAPRVAAVLTPIIAAGVNTVLDSQRRRLPGRGT